MGHLKITVVSNATLTTMNHSEITQTPPGWKEDTFVQKWKGNLDLSQYGCQGSMTAHSKIKMTRVPARLAYSNSQDIAFLFKHTSVGRTFKLRQQNADTLTGKQCLVETSYGGLRPAPFTQPQTLSYDLLNKPMIPVNSQGREECEFLWSNCEQLPKTTQLS